MPETRPNRGGGVAFLLAQLGAHAASRFAARISALDLTPPQAGLMRLISSAPGQSQQAYAGLLGMPPSRFVLLVDELEQRGAIERRRRSADRRSYALHLTPAGEKLFGELGAVARAHEDDVCSSLSAAERATLRGLLSRIAEQQHLTAGVHPGYRQSRPDPS